MTFSIRLLNMELMKRRENTAGIKTIKLIGIGD